MWFQWSKYTAWIAIAVAFIVSALLAYLIVDLAVDKDTSIQARLLLVGLGVVAVISALAATKDVPWHEQSLNAWLKPRPIAILFVAIFGAFGVLSGAIGILSPRSAIETLPGRIQADVTHIRQKVDEYKDPSDPPLILNKIAGVWGERGCGVTYQFSIAGDALSIRGVRQPPHTRSVLIIATITSARGTVLESRGVSPSESEGIAATFTFVGNAALDRLLWKDQTQTVPIELERCDAP